MEVTTVWRVNGIEYKNKKEAEVEVRKMWESYDGIVEWLDVTTFDDAVWNRTVYIAGRIYTTEDRE